MRGGFTMTSWRQMGRLLAVAAISAVLSGCTVSLVSDYDDQIDSTLSDLNTETTAFVNKMISEANTPAGTYDSNKDFYQNEEAKVDTLIARAEAHQVLNNCPSTAIVKTAVDAAMSHAGSQSGPIASSADSYLKSIPAADCEVQLFTILRQTYTDLEAFHRAQGTRGIPASAHDPILVGGVGAVIFAGITVEAAKKSSQAGQIGGGT